MISRRDFFRHLVAASAGAATFMYPNPFRPRLRFAQAQTGRTLVVIFQRGGNDGLNTVVPYGDPNYYVLRRSIAIPRPAAGSANAAIDLNGFFGLHPGLGALQPAYQAGDCAIMPAVQYPAASQSHFDSQRFLECGAINLNLDGWLNRHLVTVPQPGAALRAVGFGSELPDALRGQAIVSAFNDISEFTVGLPPSQEDALLTDLSRVYSQQPDNTKAYRNLVQSFGRVIVNDLAVLSGIDPSDYQPANGAVYPTSFYGTQLRQVAQLIKADLGLELAVLSIGGWDTHSSQGGSSGQQNSRHRDFAGGIAALYRDLIGSGNDCVILTMSEFGRTSEENGSGGTDHGHATSWFAVGPAVRGGIYGTWPGLAANQLVDGRYLNHSIDYRDVLGEVSSRFLRNNNLAAVLPDHTYRPIGFL